MDFFKLPFFNKLLTNTCENDGVWIFVLIKEREMKWLAKKVFNGGGKELFNPRSWVAHGIDFLGSFKKIMCFFKKKSTGVTILETALTLPIILYVVFFSIELIRIGLAQTAVDAITKECTFSLMAKGNCSDFDTIINKYRPLGIPIGHFRYYIRVYQYMTSPDGGTTKGVMDVSPYGGETIAWIGSDYADPNSSQTHQSNYSTIDTQDHSNNKATFSKYSTGFCAGVGSEVGYKERPKLLDGEKSSSGYIFVLTMTVKFPFSSKFVQKLFGGSNTDKDGVYILWARGSGIIN